MTPEAAVIRRLATFFTLELFDEVPHLRTAAQSSLRGGFHATNLVFFSLAIVSTRAAVLDYLETVGVEMRVSARGRNLNSQTKEAEYLIPIAAESVT